MRAIQLAASSGQALPKGAWYLEAKAAIERRREHLEAQEAREWHNFRLPILEGMRDEMQLLESKKNCAGREFCEVSGSPWDRTGP